MTSPTGIRTQSDTSILADVDEFYFGGVLPWYHGTQLSEGGKTITVTLTDPDGDEDETNEVTTDYVLTADQIRNAYDRARSRGYGLCCKDDIDSEQLGYGCVQDLDIILQTACYGELIFG